MALILAGAWRREDGLVGFPLVMAGSAFLGAGFGVTVPVLMAYARFLNACAEDRSLIALNALLALGAIAAPGIAVLFTYVAPLWGLAVIIGAALLVLLLRSARLPSHAGAPLAPPRHARSCAVRFLIYAVCAMFYAVCASIIVIWSQLMVAVPVGSATQLQLAAAVRLAQPGSGFHTSVALASLWGATLAAGRVIFAPSTGGSQLGREPPASFSRSWCWPGLSRPVWGLTSSSSPESPFSCLPASVAPRSCRSISASARKTSRPSRLRWPAALSPTSSPMTSSLTDFAHRSPLGRARCRSLRLQR